MQHRKGIASAVANRQHNMIGRDVLAADQCYATRLLPAPGQVDIDIQHLTAESNLTAQRFDCCPHFFNDAHQPKGADVRLADVQDFLGRTGFDKLIQHFAAVVFLIFDLAVQLTVGKRTGAAFTELHIRIGIQYAIAPQSPGVLGAFTDCFAAFQNDRPKTRLGQYQTGKQATRAGAYDNWTQV